MTHRPTRKIRALGLLKVFPGSETEIGLLCRKAYGRDLLTMFGLVYPDCYRKERDAKTVDETNI